MAQLQNKRPASLSKRSPLLHAALNTQRKLIQKRLERYVVRYLQAHPEIKLVVVAGSVGKTTTKRVIAAVLSQKYRIAFHDGNHNTHMSVPLSILGIEYPKLYRRFTSWLPVFATAREQIATPADRDIIVAELGTSRPGKLAHFGSYLQPDIGVITAVSPEHMEGFKTLDAVAHEELTVANFSREAILAQDTIEPRYRNLVTNKKVSMYGKSQAADYSYTAKKAGGGFELTVHAPEFKKPLIAHVNVIGDHSLQPLIGAVVVAAKLGLSADEITAGLASFSATPGRMNIIKGHDGAIIIDDTYNASLLSAQSALQTLYDIEAPQRIAILGSMNELGDSSAADHATLGNLCDPTKLDWVVTVGEEAENHLAPAASQRGCQVKSFRSAREAGAFVRQVLKPGGAVLAKGSQDSVYAEEAIKALSPAGEHAKLVRQTEQWLATKEAFFRSIET